MWRARCRRLRYACGTNSSASSDCGGIAAAISCGGKGLGSLPYTVYCSPARFALVPRTVSEEESTRQVSIGGTWRVDSSLLTVLGTNANLAGLQYTVYG